jgi:hypothetical protein
MATRVNMMKMLQQVRGMAELTGRKPQTRLVGPLLLQVHAPKWKNAGAKQRRIIRISIQEPPDIPQSVAILHLDSARNQTSLGAQPGK